jgi:hypothetical protein
MRRSPSPATRVASARSGARNAPGAAASPIAPGTASGASTSPASPAGADAGAGLYRAVAVQTLVQAEALLTAYRRPEPGRQDAESMRQTARWSREVLSSTRLLLDSPAGRDPQLRRLLSDLELVLAQIVQLSGAPLQAGERELIERAMRERDLIPRLRAVAPTVAAST